MGGAVALSEALCIFLKIKRHIANRPNP